MSLCFGNGFLTVHISTERLHSIEYNTRPPEMSIWEKFKEFLCSTHQEEALACIYKLFHHQELNLLPEEVRETFTRLRELSAPGWKDQFSIDSHCSRDEYSIKGKKGEVLLSVEVPLPTTSSSCEADAEAILPACITSARSGGEEHGDIMMLNVNGNQLPPLPARSVASPLINDRAPFRLAEEIQKLYPRVTNVSLDKIDRLIVFGDSLSDSRGRMFKKTHHIFPSYPQYYDGRFTNGFVWSEFLSSPSFLKKEILNFSEGGSTSASYSCCNPVGDFLLSLDSQIKSYSPSDKDLTIFLLGANDYITLHKNNVLKVVEQQVNDIEKILSHGVENVLVLGLPDLSATPYAEHSKDKEKMKDATIAHNALLDNKIMELKKRYTEKNILYFDTYSAFEKIKEAACKIGYDTTHAYVNHGYIHIPGTKEPALNTHPQYIYNDKVHPTQEVHNCFATILENFIVNNYGTVASMKSDHSAP